MGHAVGILTRSSDYSHALEEFLRNKGYNPIAFNPSNSEKVDILIVDVESWNKKVLDILRLKKIPVLFVSSNTTTKIISENLIGDLDRSDFVEIEIKDGHIYPEFIIHFKIGVLLKLKEGVNRKTTPKRAREPSAFLNVENFQPPKKSPETNSALIVIGSSAGGPGTLVKLLSQIKTPTPPIIIVQHITSTFAETLEKRLNKATSINLRLARKGDLLQDNCAYLAPPNHHLELEQEGRRIKINLTDGPRINFVKPAVDVTLFSASRLKGVHVISVILTGMGRDGKEGSKVVKRVGGTVIALNKEDSVVFGMNRSVIEANLTDYVLPLSDIPVVLRKLSHYLL